MHKARALTLAMLLIMGACDEAPVGSNAAAPVAPDNVAPVAASDKDAAKVMAGPMIALEGEGLRLIDPESGHATPLPFGMDKDATLRALSMGMKGRPDQVQTNNECGEGPLEVATWSKGLSAYFQAGKFVGWGGAVDLKTMDGIGFGSTRAQLDAAYRATVEQSSLGTEFSANGLSGILESDAPDAAVSEIWAGMTCIAR